MIKAVFFDWFNTLACYEPPREELYSRALSEFGIEVSAKELAPGFLTADKYFLEENARSLVEQRNPREQAEVYMCYQSMLLTGAGVKTGQDLLFKIMKLSWAGLSWDKLEIPAIL